MRKLTLPAMRFKTEHDTNYQNLMDVVNALFSESKRINEMVTRIKCEWIGGVPMNEYVIAATQTGNKVRARSELVRYFNSTNKIGPTGVVRGLLANTGWRIKRYGADVDVMNSFILEHVDPMRCCVDDAGMAVLAGLDVGLTKEQSADIIAIAVPAYIGELPVVPDDFPPHVKLTGSLNSAERVYGNGASRELVGTVYGTSVVSGDVLFKDVINGKLTIDCIVDMAGNEVLELTDGCEGVFITKDRGLPDNCVLLHHKTIT